MLKHPVTGEIRYVGKTSKSLQARLHCHLCDKVKCRRVSWIKSLTKAGLKPSIVQIEEVSPIDDWRERESFWIEAFRNAGYDLVNSTDGGEGVENPSDEVRHKMSVARKGTKISEETRRKMSQSHKTSYRAIEQRRIMNLANKGKKKTPEHIRKVIEANTGKKRSEEMRLRNSEAQKSSVRAQQNVKKMHESNRGRKHSEETRRKRSEALKGRTVSEYTRRKISVSRKRHYAKKRKQYELSKKKALYESVL